MLVDPRRRRRPDRGDGGRGARAPSRRRDRRRRGRPLPVDGERRARRAPPRRGPTVAEGIAVPFAGTLTTPIVESLVADILTRRRGQPRGGDRPLPRHREGRRRGRRRGAGSPRSSSIPPGSAVARSASCSPAATSTPGVLATILLRGLVRSGRLARLRVEISDVPGALGQGLVDRRHRRRQHRGGRAPAALLRRVDQVGDPRARGRDPRSSARRRARSPRSTAAASRPSCSARPCTTIRPGIWRG